MISEATTPSAPGVFTDAEQRQFEQDDQKAGRMIGRTLCLMFLYSALVMGGVIWWTFRSLEQRETESETRQPAPSGQSSAQ